MKISQDRSRSAVGLGGTSLPFRLDELEIAVITNCDDAGARLIRELQRTRARIQHLWPMPDRMPVIYDVVYVDLVGDLPQRLPWNPGESSTTLVLVLSPAQQVDVGLLHNCAPDGVIHQPSSPQAVLSSLVLARSHFLYTQRLRKKVDKLDENLRTMRSVERAKVILMKSRNVSEEEAYNFLRCQAMEKRITIGALASAIVDSQDLLC